MCLRRVVARLPRLLFCDTTWIWKRSSSEVGDCCRRLLRSRVLLGLAAASAALLVFGSWYYIRDDRSDITLPVTREVIISTTPAPTGSFPDPNPPIPNPSIANLEFPDLPFKIDLEPQSLDWDANTTISWNDPNHPAYRVFNWGMTYARPKQSRDLADLLNSHARLQAGICSGRKPARAVVFDCPLPCYAMADGLRGFLVAYALAVVTGRAFLINSPQLFNVETYFALADNRSLLPGELGTIDWHFRSCQPASKYIYMATGKGEHLAAESPFPDMMTPMLDASQVADPECKFLRRFAANSSTLPIVLLHTNHQFECVLMILNDYNKKHGRQVLRSRAHEPVFRTLFRRLFSFRPDIVKDVGAYLSKYEANLNSSVCLHIRSGPFFTDRAAGFSAGIDLRDFAACGLQVQALMQMEGNGGKRQTVPWIVVTDDNRVSRRMLQFLDQFVGKAEQVVLDTAAANVGPVVHLMEVNNPTMSEEHRQAGVRRILFDLYLLSQCRYLVAGKSGFAGLAAMLGADWSSKKVFAAGDSLRLDIPPVAYKVKACRRFLPTSGQ